MPLQEAYEEFLGKIPEEFHPNYTSHFNALKAFVDSIMAKQSGLPLLILNCPNGDRFITLQQVTSSRSEANQLRVIDEILSYSTQEETQQQRLEKLSGL